MGLEQVKKVNLHVVAGVCALNCDVPHVLNSGQAAAGFQGSVLSCHWIQV